MCSIKLYDACDYVSKKCYVCNSIKLRTYACCHGLPSPQRIAWCSSLLLSYHHSQHCPLASAISENRGEEISHCYLCTMQQTSTFLHKMHVKITPTLHNTQSLTSFWKGASNKASTSRSSAMFVCHRTKHKGKKILPT
jgi:hypothetical protein